MVEKYKKLDEISHILLRPSRYIGSTTPKTENIKTVFGLHERTYTPAFLKLFDEIVSNCVDFSKTDEGQHLNKVDINVSMVLNSITVTDNGGIPVVMHPEYKQYVPEMIFGELRAGSNFDDDDDSVSTGQNGEGASLVNVFSNNFSVETADGKNMISLKWSDNMRIKSGHKYKPKKSSLKYTTITYIPDYEQFGMKSMTNDTLKLLENRVHEFAATSPDIKFIFNGKHIKHDFKSFVSLYVDDFVYESGDWNLAFAPSSNGFEQITFVNSTRVYNGGTHIDYIMNQIVGPVRAFIKKKTKQDIKPSEIKNHFMLIGDLTINNPRYNSQTKEHLETEPKNYGIKPCVSEKTIKKILKSKIVDNLIEWAERKQRQDELAEARKLAKTNTSNVIRIDKYETANCRDRSLCSIFFTEGDSAAKPIIAERDPEKHGVYPLKGKPISVEGTALKKVLSNKEFQNIVKILGLEVGKPVDVKKLRYGRICIATDADPDGMHIRGLMYNMFYRFWPELFDMKIIVVFQTPIVKVSHRNKLIDFYTVEEYNDYVKKHGVKGDHIYVKGLGGHSNIKRYLDNPECFEPITFKDDEDVDSLKLAFDPKMADERKKWLCQ